MEDLIDLVATNSSPSEISDRIKQLLYARAGDNIEYARPQVAATLFGNEPNYDQYDQYDQEDENYEDNDQNYEDDTYGENE
jgi:hypothetical protein